MAAAKPYRTLIVDDHAIVREGLKQILAEVDDIEVGGEADCSSRALKMARREPSFASVILRAASVHRTSTA